MSRNLGRTDCDQCGCDVVKASPNRACAEADSGAYREFWGMTISDAECSACGAKYTAWVDMRGSEQFTRYYGHYQYDVREGRYDPGRFFDLSYRSTFNDEPGHEDMPTRSGCRWRHVSRPLAAAFFYVCKAMGPPRYIAWRNGWDGPIAARDPVESAAWWVWFDAAQAWVAGID